MRSQIGRSLWFAGSVWISSGGIAFGQSASRLDPTPAKSSLPALTLPKTSPGALDTTDFSDPGVTVIGGRRRAGFIPKSSQKMVKDVVPPALNPLSRGFARHEEPPTSVTSELPVALPDPNDEGPVSGLTLDDAIARMLLANLELKAFANEIPQAEADLITAGLRNNPLLFADTQFIPYGANNAAKRPIGPTQYDLAVILPIDVSGKRRERVRVACAARSVVQAQYQDAVRRQIANVGHAFVDLQIAYQTQTSTAKAREEHERLATRIKSDPKRRLEDFTPLESMSAKWLEAVEDANDTLGDAQEALGLLLNVPPAESASLAPRGKLRVDPPVVPPLDELIRTAARFRPDLAAARLGIGRADAEISLSKANRFDNVILFLDPITYQDNRPAHLPSGRSWDIGVTIPLPLMNRNQGNIEKARVNAHQTRLEYSALERRVASEVRVAARELKSAREALDRIEHGQRPDNPELIRKSETEFLANKINAQAYMSTLDTAQDAAKERREALVRYRRATLDLNAVVGVRLLP